jgi:excinuclease ABC subunit C
MPDLVVIDGGLGQLSAALRGMKKAGVFASNKKNDEEKPNAARSALVPVVSLAKNLEEVFAPDSSKPLNDSPDSPALILLRSLRDESHRFALASHRKRRSKLAGFK